MSANQYTEEDERENQFSNEDIVEVIEQDDELDRPLDDEGDDEYDGPTGFVPDDGQGPYHGEIIIGGPGPGEEDEDMDMDGEGGEAPREDNSWGHAELHANEQSVFTVALHPLFPNPPLAISGGEDDLGYIFCPVPPGQEPTEGFTSLTFPPTKLTGHTDSVVAAGFSSDGEMAATGGMDGKVRVWRRVKRAAGAGNALEEWKNWEFLTSMDTSSEITWLAWHPKGPVLAAGCEDAQIWMWSCETMTVLSGHTFSSQAGLWPPDGKALLTSSLDSSLILWDPRSSSPIFKSSVFVAANSPNMDPASHGITALAVSPNGQLAAVGGASGLVKLINLTAGNTVNTFKGHTEGESVEALQFIDVLGGAGGGKGLLLITGGTDGKGFVFDVASGRARAELKHDEPITSLALHPAPHIHLITSASADGMCKTWDVRTGALVAEHKGHAGLINGVAVAPAPAGETGEKGLGQVVLSAGDEGVSLIWKL